VRGSVYDGGKERHHPRITRPKVLLVVGHPSIGAALEALLRIEDRYEVRRAQTLDQVAAGLEGWRPDLAIVDGVLAQGGRTGVIAVPTLILSGDAQNGRRLAARFVDGRGWLRKDATAEEIHLAIDRVLAGETASPSRRIFVAAFVLAIALAVVIAWYVLGVRG
jgi:DNA-binding NarL/FixJ family response regulator